MRRNHALALIGALLLALTTTIALLVSNGSSAAPVPYPLVTFGTFTCTTDASGFCSGIPHGLGVAPESVTVTGKAPIAGTTIISQIDADNFTATTFRVRAFNTKGQPAAATSVTFSWHADATGAAPTTSPPPSTTTASPTPTSGTPTPTDTATSPSPSDTTSPSASPTTSPSASPTGGQADPRLTAGLEPGHTLTTITGNYNATGSLTDKHITGEMDISCSNCTFTDVQVDGIIIVSGNRGAGGYLSNITLSHVDIRSIFTYGFDGLTLDAANVHNAKNESMSQFFDYGTGGGGTAETVPARNLVIKNSWWHGYQSWSNAAHTQTIHTSGVVGAKFFGNYFDATVPDLNTLTYVSANFFEEPQLYKTYDKDFLIYGNTFLNGGYYLASIEPTGVSAVCDNAFRSTSADPHFNGQASSVNTDPKQSGRAPAGGFPAFYEAGDTLNDAPVAINNGVGAQPPAPAECNGTAPTF